MPAGMVATGVLVVLAAITLHRAHRGALGKRLAMRLDRD